MEDHIKNAIADINAEKEAEARSQVKECIRGIASAQAVIAAAQVKIKDYQRKLKEVKFETINAEDIFA